MEGLYFDNAAAGWPKAPGMESCMAAAVSTQPGRGSCAAGGAESLASCRSLLAELLELKNGKNIVLTPNATYALNIALLGFPWRSGDVVLTTVAEHNSVLRPLYILKKRGLIRDFIALSVRPDGGIEPSVLERALQNLHPRMFVFAHANPVTGALNDAAALAAFCRRYGANTLLDASQTAGIFPLQPEKWGIDMLAGSGHKYLLGPSGTGFLYAAGGMELAPLITGGTSSHADRWTMPEELPWRLEAGSANETGFSALAYSLRWNREHPIDMSVIEENVRFLERGLKDAGVSPVYVPGAHMPVLAFTGAIPPAEMGEVLWNSYEVRCSMGLHQCPLLLPCVGFEETGSVRLSFSRFTTKDELRELILNIKEILST